MEAIVKISPLIQYIIDEVRIRRLEKDFSQKGLSAKVSPSEDTSLVGKVESTKSSQKYTGPQLELLAKALECSVEDFMPPDFLPDDVFQPKTKTVIIKRMGPKAMVNSLIEHGKLKAPASLAAIVEMCNTDKEVHRKATDFTATVSRLVEENKLVKIEDADGFKYMQA